MHFLSEAFRPSEESARSERSAELLALSSLGLKASLRKWSPWIGDPPARYTASRWPFTMMKWLQDRGRK